MEFQKTGGFVCGRSGGQDIVQKKKRPVPSFRGVLELEGAIDIDRTLTLAEESLTRNGAMLDQKGSVDRRRKPRFQHRREDLRLIEMSFHEFKSIDRDGKDRVVPEIGSDSLRNLKGVFLTGLEKIIFACVLDAAQQLPDWGPVGINGPDIVQVFKTFVDQGFFHGPGKGVEIPGAAPTKDCLLKVEIGAAHFACCRIEKADKGFFVVMKHKDIIS